MKVRLFTELDTTCLIVDYNYATDINISHIYIYVSGYRVTVFIQQNESTSKLIVQIPFL